LGSTAIVLLLLLSLSHGSFFRSLFKFENVFFLKMSFENEDHEKSKSSLPELIKCYLGESFWNSKVDPHGFERGPLVEMMLVKAGMEFARRRRRGACELIYVVLKDHPQAREVVRSYNPELYRAYEEYEAQRPSNRP